jgi:hypothetical protein
VEPAIGNLKKIISGLSRRGLQAATAEVNLAAAAFNLLKIYRTAPAGRLASRPKTLNLQPNKTAGSVEPSPSAPKVISQHPHKDCFTAVNLASRFSSRAPGMPTANWPETHKR